MGRHASVLHVAAMPFPTRQGTQGAVSAMVRAHRAFVDSVDLVTYEHADREIEDDLCPHRVRGWIQDSSLRSGPSLRKLVQDGYLVQWLRKHRARYDQIVAHHVEAAMACIGARIPFSFVAHTHLESEIADYVPSLLAHAATRSAERLEGLIVARAERVYAVSPYLVQGFSTKASNVRLLPIPIASAKGDAESQTLNPTISPKSLRVAYRGNLDRYQGIEQMLSAVESLQPRVHLSLATSSQTSMQERSWLSLHTLDALPGREDLALCPRRSYGGVAMKLLDAIQRGVPVLATPEAVSGFEIPGILVAPFSRWASSLHAYAQGKSDVDVVAARAWLQRTHSPNAFMAALNQR